MALSSQALELTGCIDIMAPFTEERASTSTGTNKICQNPVTRPRILSHLVIPRKTFYGVPMSNGRFGHHFRGVNTTIAIPHIVPSKR